MATAEEMKADLYERARAYVAETHPNYGQDAASKQARNAVDAMINSYVAAGEDETAALEYAVGRDIKKLITVVLAD
ncbi:MAG: hypothetical protein LBB74_08355 [Chitinispirillales bacterium]|jgi:hypothetical protein|nr:hypothetical protein [Chitinispirillales bacterium]